MFNSNFLTKKPLISMASAIMLTFTLGSVAILCGCSTDGSSSGEMKSISVGSISMSYPAEYEVLSAEKTTDVVLEGGNGYALSRAIVGTEDYAITYMVEHAEGMTLEEAKAEVNRSMNLLDNPDDLDEAARTLAEQTIWEPIEEVRIDGRAGFISSSVMYGDIKVITYHVETGSDSVGMATGSISLEQYDEDSASFDAVFASIEVL